jgi:uncharacterized Zn finger protein (UPF0148 family)
MKYECPICGIALLRGTSCPQCLGLIVVNTPPNKKLKELATKNPPPPEWFEGEEEKLW